MHCRRAVLRLVGCQPKERDLEPGLWMNFLFRHAIFKAEVDKPALIEKSMQYIDIIASHMVSESF